MDPATVAARLAEFAGAVVLFGAPLFRLYGLDRPPAGWRSRLLAPAAVLLILGTAAALVLQTASLAGTVSPSTLLDVGAGTRFGHGLLARLALGLAAAAAAPWAASRAGAALAAALGAGVMASFAWTGHGGDGEGAAGWIHLVADVAHLWAAGVWLGALAALAALLIEAGRDAAAGQAAARGLLRFSAVGAGVVAVLVLTGAVNTLVLIGPAGVLHPLSSPYGAVLAVKLALFAGMLGLAAANRWRFAPRLARSMEAPQAALAAARHSVLVETGLGLLVLGAVALLGTLAPPDAG
jgi:putative copper resistance protein D